MNTGNVPDAYSALLTELSSQILQSRYRAARLVNRELLLLYFSVGKGLSEKIAAEKWGAKVVDRLSDDLQKQLPGLRGFSRRSLMKMVQFADVYSTVSFVQLTTAQMENANEEPDEVVPLTTAQFDGRDRDVFLGVGFTHHILLLNRCPDIGILLCREKKNAIVEYAFQGFSTPMGVATYQLSPDLPEHLRNILPDPESLSRLLD